MLSVLQKVEGLLAGITRSDIERMRPAYRRRFAQALRRVAEIADPQPKPEPPKAGVLARLHDGERAG